MIAAAAGGAADFSQHVSKEVAAASGAASPGNAEAMPAQPAVSAAAGAEEVEEVQRMQEEPEANLPYYHTYAWRQPVLEWQSQQGPGAWSEEPLELPEDGDLRVTRLPNKDKVSGKVRMGRKLLSAATSCVSDQMG